MAASDEFYRKQKTLDIVFGVTSTLMLLSIVVLFAQDYFRPWKPEQRSFRPVESAISLREAFSEIPSKEKFDKARDEVIKAKEERKANEGKIETVTLEIKEILPKKQKKEQAAGDEKSMVASIQSLYDIEVDENGPGTNKAKAYKEELTRYQERLAKAQAELDEITKVYKDKQNQKLKFEEGVNKSLAKLKILNDDLIRRVRVAEAKQWGIGDSVRSAWFLDAFNSPLKIHQFTINDLPIDYSFKYVTRFDRCMTCHQGIDRAGFSRDRVMGVMHFGEGEKRWTTAIDKIRAVLARPYYAFDEKGTKVVVSDSKLDLRRYVEQSGIKQGKIVRVETPYAAGAPELQSQLMEALEDLRDLIFNNNDPDDPDATRERMLRELDAEIALIETQDLLQDLREQFKGTPEEANMPDPASLRLTRVGPSTLTKARVTQYSAHPKLHLYVGSNSKHPAEKFGCTSCHSGQPSGTDFSYSSHTPTSATERARWEKEHDWKSIHDWEYPMLPKRFMESACLQCHHQVTDLYTSDNRNEAPKLLRGFKIIREVGCFGCHEIAGQKNGRAVGPDLRLEPTPPLDSLSPAEREKALSDPDNMPGTYRKVGPSLNRLTEKLKDNKEFVSRWIKAPREFRPDTRMPHYYGLSNNDKEALAATGPGQELFPDAEIASISHFLFEESKSYLDRVRDARKVTPAQAKLDEEQMARLGVQLNNKVEITKLQVENPKKLADMKESYDKLKELLDLRKVDAPLELPAQAKDVKVAGDTYKGRLLFSERGCLACHMHNGVSTASMKDTRDPKYLPAFETDAHFGPDLSQLTGKLLNADGSNTASAQKWLIQWLKNPWLHSPRTKMPVTHLTEEEAQNLSAWLLSQPGTGYGPNLEKFLEFKKQEKEALDKKDEKKLKELKKVEDPLEVKPPKLDTLKSLTKVYVDRILSVADTDAFLTGKFPKERATELPADEKMLYQKLSEKDASTEDQFKWYLGKKAVSRLGCFGCHSIPGFENARQIGTPLNDWGKKDPHKLAFEDIAAFVKAKYHVVESLTDKKGKPAGYDDGKAPYEQYFAEALDHHLRDGYLNQKLREPRSYDYLRERKWDDRSRMPQFKFAQVSRKEKESDEDFQARTELEEAKAREAVMTFILGLTADPIPLAYVNAPKGDRLAEVKGKLVLDKFNCASCHMIRPGTFDFKLDDKTLALLEDYHKRSEQSAGGQGDYPFLNHSSWFGPLAAAGPGGKRPEKLQAYGVAQGLVQLANPKAPQEKFDGVFLRLTTDLRFPKGSTGELMHVPAGDRVPVPISSVTYPPLGKLLRDVPPLKLDDEDEEKVERAKQFRANLLAYDKARGLDGGTFGDRLITFLQGLPGAKVNPNDDSDYRVKVPPLLLREGERTQPEWLAEWLRDPKPVRVMTVLRMPKFNLSQEEARALADYFAAVDRTQNPNVGLSYPFMDIPQRADFNDPYWLSRNVEYVKRLKDSKDPEEIKKNFDELKKTAEDAKKKAEKKDKVDLSEEELNKLTTEATAKTKMTLYERRLKQLEPFWQTQLKFQAMDLASRVEATKEETAKKALQEELEGALKALASKDVKDLKKEWETKQAYFGDAYLLVKNVCTQCHQIGDKAPDPKGTVGPSLALSWQRLRPDWTERWIAHPQRFLTYQSVMPVNFPSNQKDNWAQFFAGDPHDRIIAARDLLMIYPRVVDLPISRHLQQLEFAPPPGEKK